MAGISDTRSDRQLLMSSRSGDGGFDVFYRRHCRAVLAFHGRRAHDAELAADLTAETFAAALLAVRGSKRELPESPVAWLFTIAHRKFIDSRRRGRVEDAARRRLAFERMELSEEAIERVLDEIATTDVLRHLAERLPPDQMHALRASAPQTGLGVHDRLEAHDG